MQRATHGISRSRMRRTARMLQRNGTLFAQTEVIEITLFIGYNLSNWTGLVEREKR
jgi:hypothetical protein